MKKNMNQANVKKVPMQKKVKKFVPQQNFDEDFEEPQFNQMELNQMEEGQMPEYFGGQGPVSGLKLLNQTKENEEKKVVAVIVSFVSGSSYDNLFTTVEQKSEEGTKVLVYACQSNYLSHLIDMFEGKAEKQTEKELLAHINSLHADCVVFNWECSSGYGSETFPEKANNLFKFLKIIVDRGHMAMFSDFSLKALIKQWNSELLGPNPFVKVSETQGMFELCFKNDDLKECPSAQLQLVGEMAEKGKCNVHAISGTIVYAVNGERAQTDEYRLQILTVAHLKKLPTNKNFLSKIGEDVGTAGHVLLTYKSGGHILTSMGHWIELMKIDASEKKLFELAQEEFGAEMAEEMQNEYGKLENEDERVQYRAKKAAYFVQNQAPCENMNRKARKKK